MGKRARIFNICTDVKHPKTGETILTREKIITVLTERKTVDRYAFILHDKDTYTEAEYKKDETKQVGAKKPAHWHIVLQLSTAIDVDNVAKWFNITSNFIELPKGGAYSFIDCVQYLTHEDEKQQALGKHRYEDKEVTANFDFRELLDKRYQTLLKYGRNLTNKEELRCKVLYDGMTLKQAWEYDMVGYANDITMLQKCRGHYLAKSAKMPRFRINYYIDGAGGIGKNTASRALAKILYPDIEEPFFEVGGNNVSFQAYDGQPVIIWNDYRALDLVMKFGRGEVFDIFDSHPTNSEHNVKYGSTKLINEVNIVNGVESYQDFLNGLAGEYTTKWGDFREAEDKGQAYRRFPIIMCLRESDFDVLLNKGVANGTREYEQYLEYARVRGSFQKVAHRLEDKAKDKVMISMMKPTISATDKVKEMETQKIDDPDNIDEFADYGTILPPTPKVIDEAPQDTEQHIEQAKMPDISYKSDTEYPSPAKQRDVAILLKQDDEQISILDYDKDESNNIMMPQE